MKKVAVNIVRDLTGSEDGLQSLAKFWKTVLPSLSSLINENKVCFLVELNSLPFNPLKEINNAGYQYEKLKLHSPGSNWKKVCGV